MLYAKSADELRRRRLIAAVVAIVLLLTGVAVYAVLTHRATVSPAGQPRPQSASPVQPSIPTAVAVRDLPALEPTIQPEHFARLVAHALFDWDTLAGPTLADYTGRLVAVADPTGEESPGLVSDVANYLPTVGAWTELRPYSTRQWIEITSSEVPSLWPQAVAEAGPTGLAPGTTAYTIEGVRHRTGIWEGAPVTSAHEVSFTVFVVCEPSYPKCHLLRLSMLDKPLG